MPDAPTTSATTHRSRLAAAAAGALGGVAITALLLGAGPAPSIVPLQLAGNSDDVPGDLSGNCDEAEHAADPECAGTPTSNDDGTSTTLAGSTSTTAGGAVGTPDAIRSIDAAGAGTVIVAVEGNSLRLVAATPASGWRVEVEQSAGREIELDFRAGTRRVQVNVELEDGQVRERVRVRDDADDTDIRTEDGVVVRDDAVDDNSGPGSGAVDDDSSGPGSGSIDDDSSGSGHGGDDAGDDHSGSGSSGSGRDHPEDD
jgi:hypothetical protein